MCIVLLEFCLQFGASSRELFPCWKLLRPGRLTDSLWKTCTLLCYKLWEEEENSQNRSKVWHWCLNFLPGLRTLNWERTASKSPSLTRSILQLNNTVISMMHVNWLTNSSIYLLSRIISANEICLSASGVCVPNWTPFKCLGIFLASTMVTTASRKYLPCDISWLKKVCRIGVGSWWWIIKK